MKQCLRQAWSSDLARRNVVARTFTTACRCSQQSAQNQPSSPSQTSREPSITTHAARGPSWHPDRPEFYVSSHDRAGIRENVQRPHRPTIKRPLRPNKPTISGPPPVEETRPTDVGAFVDGEPHRFAAVLLRDLCECPSCVDPSTKQKLFSTADIPLEIRARAVAQTSGGTSILWDHDVAGYTRSHTTELSTEVLRNLAQSGFTTLPYSSGQQLLWVAEMFNQVQDIDYEAYMQDDTVLYKALHQLHTHGLLFVSNVPESEKSVSTIGERIGPIKNTFYGYTWDVRSVPEAINVAYTSQDLGFHMDLLYMHQPPHLQLLHCIRSSAQGGASLFTDSYRAAQQLFENNVVAFNVLSKLDATFHYNHPTSNLYRQQRPVFQMRPLRNGGTTFRNAERMQKAWDTDQSYKITRPAGAGALNIVDYIDHVNWSPPFQGPLSISASPRENGPSNHPPLHWLNRKASKWHAAAREYSALLHRAEGIYERLMRPGECVIFDNRRVLHARRAFEVGDAGTERWLRGAYLDKDPYDSKLHVLQKRFGNAGSLAAGRGYDTGANEQYFEAAAAS